MGELISLESGEEVEAKELLRAHSAACSEIERLKELARAAIQPELDALRERIAYLESRPSSETT